MKKRIIILLAPVAAAMTRVIASSPLSTTPLAAALTSALHAPRPLNAKEWHGLANALRDSACDLAAQAEFDYQSETCAAVLDEIKASEPELFAVAKLSAKRNGDFQTDRRACERCLAELGLIVSTYAALEAGAERQALLNALRPIAQTVPTAMRLRTLLVVGRGFHTPGAGPTAHGWRSGKGTVQQLVSRVSGADGTTPAVAALDAWLASAPEDVRQHSKALRAVLPLIDPPLQLWLRGLKPAEAEALSLGGAPDGSRGGVDGASAGMGAPSLGAAALLVELVDAEGAAGAKLAQAISEWAVDVLYESLERPGSDGAPSATVLARAHESDVAKALLLTHGPLVKGSGRTQKRWLSSVDRLGHAVWLLLTAAREARAELAAEAGDGKDGKDGVPAGAGGRRVFERVRAVMLACSLLERSDATRPRFRAAMTRAHTTPAWLWRLLGDALSLNVAPAAGDGSEAGTPDESARASGVGSAGDGALAGALGGARVGEAAARLLTWGRPELVFKYLELHKEDEVVSPLARRWLHAVLDLGGESVHELRCCAHENAAHFERVAASGAAARVAVDAWIAADKLGCSTVAASSGGGDGKGGDGDGVPPGVCDPQTLFMMGEELRTCMRIDGQCVRENAALLGYLTQGTVRLLSVMDEDDSTDAAGQWGRTSGRVAARTTARLLGRIDTAAPVVFLDQPLYGHHMSTGIGGAAHDATIKAALDERLVVEGRALGARLGLPVVDWRACVAPACDAAAARGDGYAPSARADAVTRKGRIALVEFDGIAPQTYCNLRGRLIRGTEAARGQAPALREEEEAIYPEAAASAVDEERMTVYAFAPMDALGAEGIH